MLKILDQRPAEAGSWDVTFETPDGERLTLHLKDGEPKDVQATVELFHAGVVQREKEREVQEAAEKVREAAAAMESAVQLVAANLEKLDGPMLDRAVNLVASNLARLEPDTVIKMDTALQEAKRATEDTKPVELPVKGGR